MNEREVREAAKAILGPATWSNRNKSGRTFKYVLPSEGLDELVAKVDARFAGVPNVQVSQGSWVQGAARGHYDRRYLRVRVIH